MQRKCYADMHGYKLLYTTNRHPAYSLYEGRLSMLFASISDIEDSEIINFADKNYSKASHEDHYLLKYTDTKEFLESSLIKYNVDIGTTNWHEFKPDCFETIEEYRADVIKKIAEPSEEIKKYLNNLSFIREVSELNGSYIAVHIRWTDKVAGWCAETDFYDVDVYFKHCIELREKYGTNDIVLNCDNVDALSRFLDFNTNKKLNFNILYDDSESLPKNDWKECIFQKWIDGSAVGTEAFVKDLLNGFKIYKTIFEADSVVCNYFSNMALAPCLARNNKKDINVSNRLPYSIFPGKYWPADMFTESVKTERKKDRNKTRNDLELEIQDLKKTIEELKIEENIFNGTSSMLYAKEREVDNLTWLLMDSEKIISEILETNEVNRSELEKLLEEIKIHTNK
jgi:hypothetical protein